MFVGADSFSLHIVIKSVLMHAELLLSDPLMFVHIDECDALYLIVLFPRIACQSFLKCPNIPLLQHCELIFSSSQTPCF